jgi:hypothetical protein
VPRATCPRTCTLMVSGPAVVSPPTNATPYAFARSAKGQGQGGPGRSRPHRRQVAQIYGQRTVAYRSGVAIVRKMPADDHGIYRRRQFRIRRHAQQSRVIAHS